MEDIGKTILNATKNAIYFYGDEATKEFYANLKKRKFTTTRCKKCKKVFFPPREFCPHCLSNNLEWIELSGKGKLYAFTQQERSIRFPKPDVVGLIELDEKVGKVFTRIDAQLEELKIGQKMQISFINISDEITLHQFKPAK